MTASAIQSTISSVSVGPQPTQIEDSVILSAPVSSPTMRRSRSR